MLHAHDIGGRRASEAASDTCSGGGFFFDNMIHVAVTKRRVDTNSGPAHVTSSSSRMLSHESLAAALHAAESCRRRIAVDIVDEEIPMRKPKVKVDLTENITLIMRFAELSNANSPKPPA